jgi:hypothetical protein
MSSSPNMVVKITDFDMLEKAAKRKRSFETGPD